MIKASDNVFTIMAAFERSDGYLAVMDDEDCLAGLFGRKEYSNLIGLITGGHDILSLRAKDVMNQSFRRVVYSENADEDIRSFFAENNYAYAPVVSENGRFIEFAVNANSPGGDLHSKLLKRVIAERWHIYDKFEYLFNHCDFPCLICGGKINTATAEKKITACIFGGGKLIRYVCPHCGAIVGPLKMLALNAGELAEDYQEHYTVFQEGDTTNDEIETFFALNPNKNKRYLNYGCGGNWSHSIQILRGQGYDVYGYEPFAEVENSKSKFILTNAETIKSMKFDGIFSNNLLEHLTSPIEELRFMKSLLRDCESVMAHATGCYEYLYPYTRFHLCFPVGKSAEIMFANAGLVPFNRIEKALHGDKYICVCCRKSG